LLPAYSDLEELRGLPTPLQLFDYVSRSHHLHFGLFEPGDSIASAQDRMALEHLAWLPFRARRILDVGCGVGGTACMAALRGHDVVGIVPDARLAARSRRLAVRCGVSDRVRIEGAKFEELPAGSRERFDAVLFLESFQHVPDAAAAFAAVAALLPAGGRCVIGDQVRRGRELDGKVRWHDADAIVRAAQATGFELLHRADLATRALPTIGCGCEALSSRRDELLRFFAAEGGDLAVALDTCIRHGRIEEEWWRAGVAGWELLVFER
jgi:cyclopropane fatty-acyl-phospholipid synthase-like methyltransferase